MNARLKLATALAAGHLFLLACGAWDGGRGSGGRPWPATRPAPGRGGQKSTKPRSPGGAAPPASETGAPMPAPPPPAPPPARRLLRAGADFAPPPASPAPLAA